MTYAGLAEQYSQRVEEIKRLASALEAAQARIAELEATAAVLAQALEDDEADLWHVTNAITNEIASRHWVTEGRGPYEWNDDDYRLEASRAFEAVLKLIAEVQPPAASRFIGVRRNFPAAVQQHMEKDRAADRFIKKAEHGDGCSAPYFACTCGLTEVIEAAYSAAGGEGK